jgi:hypothetical protein
VEDLQDEVLRLKDKCSDKKTLANNEQYPFRGTQLLNGNERGERRTAFLLSLIKPLPGIAAQQNQEVGFR